jgi:hypothetical protein
LDLNPEFQGYSRIHAADTLLEKLQIVQLPAILEIKNITSTSHEIPLNDFIGTESYLRSCQLFRYSRISQYYMQYQGSLTWSKATSTGPYPQPIPVHTTPSYPSEIHFNIVTYLPHARTVEPENISF